MARLTINISPELEVKLLRRVEGGGYSDPQAYLRDLILADTDGLDGPAHLLPGTKEGLEHLLIEGLNSGPAVEITPDDWDQRRGELIKRHTMENTQ